MAPTSFALRKNAITGDSDNRTVEYLSRGEEDENAVLDYAETNAPTTWDGMNREGFSVDELHPGIFSVRARYTRRKPEGAGNDGSLRENGATGSAEFSFDVGLDNQRILYSLSTLGFQPANAPQHANAINVKTDGLPEGVDILVPRSQFEYNFTIPTSTLDDSYKLLLESRVGTVNIGTFKGRAAGCVMLMGVRGREVVGQPSQISFSFAYRPPTTWSSPQTIAGIDVGSPGFTLDGWDYIWVQYGKSVDAGAFEIAAKAIGFYIERVYNRTDFDDLGLP